jgi:hypothetical protein
MKSILFIVLPLLLAGRLQSQSIDPANYFTAQEIASANTAKEVRYLTAEEKDIFLYNNLARMYPKKFHKLYLDYCQRRGTSHMMDNHYYKTLSEGLLNNQPASALLPDRPMFELAECWAKESGETGIIGHDRTTCQKGYWAENCAYGNSRGLDIVMQLLIDYGVESLGHRRNMLNPNYKGMGTAIRPHKGYGTCAVQDFTYTNDVLRAEEEKRKAEELVRQAELERKLKLRQAEFTTQMAKWTAEERRNADVCRSFAYLSDYEKDVYFFVNLARLYPKKFKTLIWDQGPYFDELLEDLKDGLHNEKSYLDVGNYLSTASPQKALIPTEPQMDMGRCVLNNYLNNAKPLACMNGMGSWFGYTGYSENEYNDIMKLFMKSFFFSGVIKGNQLCAVSGGSWVTFKNW